MCLEYDTIFSWVFLQLLHLLTKECYSGTGNPVQYLFYSKVFSADKTWVIEGEIFSTLEGVEIPCLHEDVLSVPRKYQIKMLDFFYFIRANL